MKKLFTIMFVVCIVIAFVIIEPGKKVTHHFLDESEVLDIIETTYETYSHSDYYENQNVLTREYYADDTHSLSELLGIQVNRNIIRGDRARDLIALEEIGYYLIEDENKYTTKSYYIMDLKNNVYYDGILSYYSDVDFPLKENEKDYLKWIKHENETFPYYFNFFDYIDLNAIEKIDFIDDNEIFDIFTFKKVKVMDYSIVTKSNHEYILSIRKDNHMIEKIKYEYEYLYNDENDSNYPLQVSDRNYLENLEYDFDNHIAKIKVTYEVFLSHGHEHEMISEVKLPEWPFVKSNRHYDEGQGLPDFVIGPQPSEVDFSPSRKYAVYIDDLSFEQIGNIVLYDLDLDDNAYLTSYDLSQEVDNNMVRPLSVKWLNDDELLILEGPTYGTVVSPGRLYKYNIYTKEKKEVIAYNIEMGPYDLEHMLDENGNILYDNQGNRRIILKIVSYADEYASQPIYSLKPFN